jgi:hypothetical protein
MSSYCWSIVGGALNVAPKLVSTDSVSLMLSKNIPIYLDTHLDKEFGENAEDIVGLSGDRQLAVRHRVLRRLNEFLGNTRLASYHDNIARRIEHNLSSDMTASDSTESTGIQKANDPLE